MNKILIVGHPQSGYEEVEALLNACGMAGAQPSRREGYLPQQISATLCKAHNASTLQPIEAGSDIRQIKVGPLWHGMALDLMLGNLEQAFWGWSDPQAIFLLDYWLSLDPDITFVFVYDKPQSVLTRMDAQTAAGLDPQSLQCRAQGWTSYNAALLHFFLRHPQRCLLVNTQQVRASAASYLQQMRARIDAPWSERMDQLAGPLALTEGGAPVDADTSADSLALAAADWTAATSRRPPSDALTSYLAEALLSQHTSSLQLYEEMQASANLPLSDEASRTMPAALDAWQSMVARQLELQAQAIQLDQTAHEAQTLKGRLDEQTRVHASEIQAQQQRLAELAKARASLETHQRESEEENALLLNQLHQVQEELERKHQEATEKAQRLDALHKAEADLRQTGDEQQKQLRMQQEQLARLQAKEKEFQERLQALQAERTKTQTTLETRQRESEEENELLLNQLHQVQEELERYYLEAQKLKQKAAPAKPAEPVYYGAGQRIRQQLSYKLGATMIERSRSVGGWFSMPVELLRVARQHKRELPLRAAQKLPPIHKYRDAHEAERHRNHLSYRLGQTLLQNVRSPIGWVRLPSAISREVREHRSRQSKG